MPVESIKRGDLVTTADGRTVPVAWLGIQTVSRQFSDPLRVWPIRVKAGALDENVPSRDLLISPDHAILVDGALVQAGALVNGTSITREDRLPAKFTYYHVETDDHSLILAHNVPAETFVDNVDRLGFDNWREHAGALSGRQAGPGNALSARAVGPAGAARHCGAPDAPKRSLCGSAGSGRGLNGPNGLRAIALSAAHPGGRSLSILTLFAETSWLPRCAL